MFHLAKDPKTFYNEFADDYPRMHGNLLALVEKEQEILGPLIEQHCRRPEGLRIIDFTCGPGTQSIGLANRRHKITAIDISERMINGLHHRTKHAGLALDVVVCDMKALPFSRPIFDAGICLGNSICTFTTPEELGQAFASAHGVLQPNAPFIVGLRDYEEALISKPTINGPHYHIDQDGKQTKVCQRWHWITEVCYECSVEINDAAMRHEGAVCRAWGAPEIAALLIASGFHSVCCDAGRAPHTLGQSVYEHGFDELIVIGCA